MTLADIAAVHSFEHADDLRFLVMELVEGEDLSQKSLELRERGERLR